MPNISLPDHILVGPYKIDVVCNTIAMNAVQVELARELMGHFNSQKACITLSPDNEPEAQVDTLVHEVMHAVIAQTPFSEQWHGSDTEELVVQAITPLLVGLIRQNPGLMEMITDGV